MFKNADELLDWGEREIWEGEMAQQMLREEWSKNWNTPL